MKEKTTTTKTKQDKQTNQQSKTSEQTKEDSNKKVWKEITTDVTISPIIYLTQL